MITREQIIRHIMAMKKIDPECARAALRHYHEKMPWMNLIEGIKQAMREQ